MKNLIVSACAIAAALSFSACANAPENSSVTSDATASVSDEPLQNKTTQQSDGDTLTEVDLSASEEKNNMLSIEIIVGEKVFSATLYDNEAARAFTGLLPLTLEMSELNGNEKYYYFDSLFPTDQSKPSGIKTGDLMLYGDSCLVLFYESFSTSYSYTPIGHIDDPTGLAEALGSSAVQVTFRD